jgi:inward rectifier potassium channel
MTKDGTFQIRRVGVRSIWHRDLYHYLRTTTWPRLVLSLSLLWLVANALFALLYLAGGPCIANAEEGSFSDAFFFSVQTMATIGYGALSPATPYANVLVTVEAFFGLLVTAGATGLFFAKLSTPTARVMFAEAALIGTSEGKPTFMFRMANERASQIVDATVRVTIARDEMDERGAMTRRLYDLELVRERSPFFALTFTAMHVIDEASPLHGATEEALLASNTTALVTLTGIEESLVEQVHARYAYSADRIFIGHRYVDVLRVDELGERYVDYTRFHEHEPA